MNALLETLISWDRTVFLWINSDMSNPVFDFVLPWCRERFFWAPLYLFVVSFMWTNYGKKGWLLVIGLMLTVGLTDFTSSTLVKKNVERPRPCRDELLAQRIVRRTDCGSGFSFTSSHAANHFAVAVFIIGLFGATRRWIKPAAIIWASLIAISQVYVGLHFPGDIIGGAIIGSGIAWAGARFVRRYVDVN
jgi:undecaprenyl-diphosphatase